MTRRHIVFRQRKNLVSVQQHHICFVIGLLMCNSTLRRPLPRICGTAERLQSQVYLKFGTPDERLQNLFQDAHFHRPYPSMCNQCTKRGRESQNLQTSPICKHGCGLRNPCFFRRFPLPWKHPLLSWMESANIANKGNHAGERKRPQGTTSALLSACSHTICIALRPLSRICRTL